MEAMETGEEGVADGEAEDGGPVEYYYQLDADEPLMIKRPGDDEGNVEYVMRQDVEDSGPVILKGEPVAAAGGGSSMFEFWRQESLEHNSIEFLWILYCQLGDAGCPLWTVLCLPDFLECRFEGFFFFQNWVMLCPNMELFFTSCL